MPSRTCNSTSRLLDLEAQGGRAANPVTRSILRHVDRPLQLPADLARYHQHPLCQSQEHPAITPNAFGTQHDIDEMLAAVKFHPPDRRSRTIEELIIEELRPVPQSRAMPTSIHDFKQRSGTVYHPSCTCRMGPDRRHLSWTSRLRVSRDQWLAGLRCVRFPPIFIAGNTNAHHDGGLEGRGPDPRRPPLGQWPIFTLAKSCGYTGSTI